MTDGILDSLESMRAGFAEIFGIDPEEVEIVVENGDRCSICYKGQHDPQDAPHHGESA